MVVMNIELDNFLLFNDFKLNLSYSKKPVSSSIPNEHLTGRTNFRYRKLVILMGANATGKTALSRVMMAIFNFIAKKEYSSLTGYIENPAKKASFTLDLAFPDHTLYRITCNVAKHKRNQTDYKTEDFSVTVNSEPILKNDSYERCLSRLLGNEEAPPYDNYIKALEAVPFLTWKFEDPFAANGKQRAIDPIAPEFYAGILEKTLLALDPRIREVTRVQGTDNTFLIRFENNAVVIKDGVVMEPEKLSRGTADGIYVATLITAMKLKAMDFFFADEIFSHIHSDAEKAFLSLLIELLGENQQLFITTHNTDILELDLPLHSFAFLRRNENDPAVISCVYASDYIKRNNVSLKNAVENDIFSASPDTDHIFAIGETLNEVAV